MLKNKKILSIILLLILFCIITVLVNVKDSLIIDEKIYSLVSMLYSETATTFFKIITYFGNAKFIFLLCIVLLFLTKVRNKVGIPITITVVIAGIINITLKNIFERQRPLLEQLVYEDSFSFPSGHSMIIATIYSMIIYLSCIHIKNNKIKYIINIISGLIIFTIGISRVYLRVHYFSDVLAGWILGIIIVLAYAILEDRLKNGKVKMIKDV